MDGLPSSSTAGRPGMHAAQEQLEAIHTMHTYLLNPKQDSLINAHLEKVHATGRRSRVLDVGTGTGTWAMALARKHPYADLVGVDNNWSAFLAADIPHGNIDFQTVDVTQPLPWPPDTFDVIHVKSMLMDVPHYPNLVQRLAEPLRPGGLLILVESELRFESTQGPPASAVTTWSDSLRVALAAKNTDIDLPERLDSTIAATGAFEPQFYFQEVGCPVGDYMSSGSKALQHAGRIQAAVIRASLQLLVWKRLEPGPERDMLERLTDACTSELVMPQARYVQRLFAVYAYKKMRGERRSVSFSLPAVEQQGVMGPPAQPYA